MYVSTVDKNAKKKQITRISTKLKIIELWDSKELIKLNSQDKGWNY
jgi:hypothetical protein